VSVGSFILGAALSIRGKPNIQVNDDLERRQNFLFQKLTASKILTPPIIKPNYHNILLFNSLKEWAYLSPKYFKPNKNILKTYGLTAYKYLFIREISTGSLNYKDQTDGLILSFAESIGSDICVVLSLENKKNKDKYPEHWMIINEPESDLHSLIYYSQIVISSGDSIAREGAQLGIPSIYCGIREMLANKLLEKENMLFHVDPINVLSFITKIREKRIKIIDQEAFRRKLNLEWDDVNLVILKIINEYGK